MIRQKQGESFEDLLAKDTQNTVRFEQLSQLLLDIIIRRRRDFRAGVLWTAMRPRDLYDRWADVTSKYNKPANGTGPVDQPSCGYGDRDQRKTIDGTWPNRVRATENMPMTAEYRNSWSWSPTAPLISSKFTRDLPAAPVSVLIRREEKILVAKKMEPGQLWKSFKRSRVVRAEEHYDEAVRVRSMRFAEA